MLVIERSKLYWNLYINDIPILEILNSVKRIAVRCRLNSRLQLEHCGIAKISF